jgi:hypothetical protein
MAVPVMYSLLTHGDVTLDRYVTRWTPVALYTIECVGPGGELKAAELSGCPELYHAYPRYSIATPVLALPLFFALDRVAPLAPGWTAELQLLRERRYLDVSRVVEVLLGSAVVGLCAVFVFLANPARGPAWLWTMAFGFGTSAWSIASRALWSHGMSMLLLAAALYLLLGKRRWPFLAGVLLGLAVWCRPLNAIPLFCLAVWLRRDGWRLLAGAAAASAPFVIYCLAVYRMPVQPYFLVGNLYVWDAGRAAGALLGQLVSPGRGLLVYSPFVALVPLGAARWWKKDRGLVVALFVWFVLHAAAISFFGDWTGGRGYGPRYWTDILPGVFVLLGAVWPVRRWMYVLLVWAVLLHARGAMDVRTTRWDQRWGAGQTSVWDWKGAPFLAGITW